MATRLFLLLVSKGNGAGTTAVEAKIKTFRICQPRKDSKYQKENE